MKKIIATTIVAGVALLAPATSAAAGDPTCADMFGSGWKNHGEHVLGYVEGEGAAGGAPAHRGHERSTSPAPGASFCLPQAKNPGVHFGPA